MIFEWMAEPSAWAGLLTLVLLEIVLGIDNLIFIAILVEKLPPRERDRARVVGLSLALLMRLVLLSVMSWLVTLTEPWLFVGPFAFSQRDLILIVGGMFLLMKGTVELHERVEGKAAHSSANRMHAGFGVIVLQIVVLDAVFSLDSVITAVGMVDHLSIMMIAVTIAIGLMLLASKPLTRFVNAHPTVVILCLGFLLTIGFTLVIEGFGFHLPKGYLYAAITFSVLIETLNQLARRNIRRQAATRPLRERTAEGVLRMLGMGSSVNSQAVDATSHAGDTAQVFEDEERYMVSGVLTLAERSIRSVMTPRTEVCWLNLNDSPEALRERVLSSPHSFFPVCKGSLDEVVGIGRAKEIVADLIEHGIIRVSRLREPVIVHESIGMLKLMETLKQSRGKLVLVTDEFGAIDGLVTPIDVFEAIAGEFPDEDETPDIQELGEGRWRVDGAADLMHLELLLQADGLVDEEADFTTIAGFLLGRFDHLPQEGDRCELQYENLRFEFTVEKMEGRRIATVLIERRMQETDDAAGNETE
ncbi:MAG TPA: TerC family protein [Burkholderiaceae bacterium]|nr:TerC family protein [Burkholderiaceae bacterium]